MCTWDMTAADGDALSTDRTPAADAHTRGAYCRDVDRAPRRPPTRRSRGVTTSGNI